MLGACGWSVGGGDEMWCRRWARCQAIGTPGLLAH